jgi:sec-independent protein translocase protein TatA
MIGLENPLHIALILIVVLLVFGAKRLPDMGRSLGEGMRGFKQSLTGDPTATQIGSETHQAGQDESRHL